MGLYDDVKEQFDFWMFGGGAVAIGILALFMWIGGCTPEKEVREDTKVEKTIYILDKQWEKWIDKHED